MSKVKEEKMAYIYGFSKEKLDEFKDMTVRQRLLWLEETNVFINKTLGLRKRAISDPRFEVLADLSEL